MYVEFSYGLLMHNNNGQGIHENKSMRQHAISPSIPGHLLCYIYMVIVTPLHHSMRVVLVLNWHTLDTRTCRY